MVFPPKDYGIFGPTHPKYGRTQYGRGLGQFFSDTGRAIRGINVGNFWGKPPKAKPKTPPNLRQKAFFNKIGNVLNPALKEVEGIVSDVGTELVGKVLQDVITGKDAKTSLKDRGKEAGIKAVNTSIKRIEKRKRDPSESKSNIESKKQNIQIQTKRNQLEKVDIKRPKSEKKRKTPRKEQETPRKKERKTARKEHETARKKSRRKKRNKAEPKDIFTST